MRNFHILFDFHLSLLTNVLSDVELIFQSPFFFQIKDVWYYLVRIYTCISFNYLCNVVIIVLQILTGRDCAASTTETVC